LNIKIHITIISDKGGDKSMAMWFDDGESTKSRLMQELIAEIKRVGRPVTWREFKDSGKEPNNYAYYWGSFEEAVRAALNKIRLNGRKPPRAQSEMDKLIATGKAKLVVHVTQDPRIRPSRMSARVAEPTETAKPKPHKKRKRRYEYAEVLAQLKQIQEYYHISGEPTEQQIATHAAMFGTACYQVFRKTLGAKGTWMEKAGR